MPHQDLDQKVHIHFIDSTFSFYWWNSITLLGRTSCNWPSTVVNKTYIVFTGKGKISTVIAIVIGVTIAASEVLVILLYCFLRRRARKKSNDINKENSQKSDCLLIYHGMQLVLCSNHMSHSPHFQKSTWWNPFNKDLF